MWPDTRLSTSSVIRVGDDTRIVVSADLTVKPEKVGTGITVSRKDGPTCGMILSPKERDELIWALEQCKHKED